MFSPETSYTSLLLHLHRTLRAPLNHGKDPANIVSTKFTFLQVCSPLKSCHRMFAKSKYININTLCVDDHGLFAEKHLIKTKSNYHGV